MIRFQFFAYFLTTLALSTYMQLYSTYVGKTLSGIPSQHKPTVRGAFAKLQKQRHNVMIFCTIYTRKSKVNTKQKEPWKNIYTKSDPTWKFMVVQIKRKLWYLFDLWPQPWTQNYSNNNSFRDLSTVLPGTTGIPAPQEKRIPSFTSGSHHPTTWLKETYIKQQFVPKKLVILFL